MMEDGKEKSCFEVRQILDWVGARGGNLTCPWYGVVPFLRVPFS